MKAMVLAAGLGTRLRPLTYEIAKPLVPVLNRPIMAHILELVRRHGFTEVIANLSYLPEQLRKRFGDGSEYGLSLEWSFEEELLGTAGGVRNVRGFLDRESFLVMAADALTDIDLTELVAAHRSNDGIATLAVKRVPDTSGYGVVVTGSDGRVQGFQEKPPPSEALSNLASCMIYVLEPQIFDYFPDTPVVDFALDVFPTLLENDVPFYVHETEAYWNDVGSLPELLRGCLDGLEGAVQLEPAGEILTAEADPNSPGEHGLAEERAGLPVGTEVNGRVLVGERARVGEAVRIDGGVVIGDGGRIGDGARIKDSVLLPGAEVPAEGLVAGSLIGRRGALGRYV
jgi:mannose-1-phosphate guanylyltransferase